MIEDSDDDGQSFEGSEPSEEDKPVEEKKPPAEQKSAEEIQLQKLNEINEKFNAWEERLNHENEEVSKLENHVNLKGALFDSIENNLEIIEDRQNKFDKLLQMYESQSGNPLYSRFEILEKTKSLSRNLEDHNHEIEQMNNNIQTLKDMIYLISDIHCKYSKLKRMIPRITPGEEAVEEEEEEEFEHIEEEELERIEEEEEDFEN